MKKNKMMRIASVLLVAVLLSTSVISGTFAKYTTTSNGSDTARVAKWDIDFAGNDDQTKVFVFDLFNTVNDITDGENDENVKDADDDTAIIAPGTSGSFEIKLINQSEVTAKYYISYSVENANNIPVEFKVGNGEWNSDITAFNIDVNNAVEIAMTNGTATINVQWRWEFERGEGDTLTNNNNTDTNLGITTPTIEVAATVTVEQVD